MNIQEAFSGATKLAKRIGLELAVTQAQIINHFSGYDPTGRRNIRHHHLAESALKIGEPNLALRALEGISTHYADRKRQELRIVLGS